MRFKTLFKILLKQGSRSSVAFYARADMQRKGNPLERGLLRSSGLQATVKVLDARNSRSMGARYPIERETQVLARACITPLERTA